jgi:hypothetical protein
VVTRRDHLRALAQRVEVDAKDAKDAKEVRIMGIEKRTAAHPRCCLERENGFWRFQLCTEVARPIRFELVTSAFGGQRIDLC